MVIYAIDKDNTDIPEATDAMAHTTEDVRDTLVNLNFDDLLHNKTLNISHLMNFSYPFDSFDSYNYEDYFYGCTYEEVYNDECVPNCEIDYGEDFDKTMHIVLPIICLVGIVGIILTVIVLSRKHMSTSTNCYLTSLAITDLCFLLFLGIKFVEISLSREGHYIYVVISNYIHIFLDMFLLASVWLTVMLAIERYIAICHPLRAMSICTVQRARFIILGIFVFSLACRLPNFFRYRVISFKDECLQKEVVFFEHTAMGKDETFRRLYAWIVNCFICAVLPFSALLFLNGCLIREIHRSTNYLRYHLAIDSNVQTIITGEEVKITMMLISVIIVFFVCQAPYVILAAIKAILLDQIFEHFKLLTDVTNLLLVLRSSFNFVLYCWFSEKFWNTFKRTFCVPACRILRRQSWIASRVVGNTSEHGGHSNNNHGHIPLSSSHIPLSSSRLTNGHVETIKEVHSNEV